MILAGFALLRDELLLFAGVGLLLGGLDDLCVDFIYAVRRYWRNATIYRHNPRMTARRSAAPRRFRPDGHLRSGLG